MFTRKKKPETIEEPIEQDYSLLDESTEDAIKRLTVGRGEKGPYPLEECIDAFIRGEGYISRAARILGVTTQTFDKYISRYKLLRELVLDYQSARLDEAERKLMTLVRAGDIAAIRFFLTTQGKVRGYLPESKINTNNKSSMEATVNGKMNIKTYLEFAKSIMFEEITEGKGKPSTNGK